MNRPTFKFFLKRRHDPDRVGRAQSSSGATGLVAPYKVASCGPTAHRESGDTARQPTDHGKSTRTQRPETATDRKSPASDTYNAAKRPPRTKRTTLRRHRDAHTSIARPAKCIGRHKGRAWKAVEAEPGTQKTSMQRDRTVKAPRHHRFLHSFCTHFRDTG